MGEIIELACSRCGNVERITTGIGMLWDCGKIFNGIVDSVNEGKYGAEWRSELEKDPSLIVNISDEIYICPTCGCFKTGLNLSLFKRVEEKQSAESSMQKTDSSGHTLKSKLKFHLFKKHSQKELPPEPLKQERYGFSHMLESNPRFQLMKEYPHLCEKCNKQMIAYRPRDNSVKPVCPKCGEKGNFKLGALWD